MRGGDGVSPMEEASYFYTIEKEVGCHCRAGMLIRDGGGGTDTQCSWHYTCDTCGAEVVLHTKMSVEVTE